MHSSASSSLHSSSDALAWRSPVVGGRWSVMSDEDPDEDENSLLGDKTHICKTLVRHIVASIMADVSDGRRFEQLDILELGAGDGFFVRSYAEVYAEGGRGDLPNLVQTDSNPQHGDVPRHADTYASAWYARGAGQLAEGHDSLRVRSRAPVVVYARGTRA